MFFFKKKKHIVDIEVMLCLAVTEAQVKKTLAKEEEKYLNDGGSALHTTSPSAFLTLGLELEDTQYIAFPVPT